MADIIVQLLRVASIIFIVRAFLSWIRPGGDSPLAGIVSVIYTITEPVLAPIRRAIPPLGGFDLSVIAVILIINYLLIPLVVRTLG